jgi:hypothetical protein
LPGNEFKVAVWFGELVLQFGNVRDCPFRAVGLAHGNKMQMLGCPLVDFVLRV